MLTKTEIQKLEKYFQSLMNTQGLYIKEGNSNDAPAEVYKASEFLGVIYKNEDEGEISYDFHLTILPEDLSEGK